MQNVINKDVEKWVKPWELEKYDNIYNRDDRFFAIIIKGLLSWLQRNIILYNKPIMHFIFNTGSSYLYMESNGYEYNMSETTGEDSLYMTVPRCLVEFTNVTILLEELSSGYASASYNRISNNTITEFNSIVKRIPLSLDIKLKYILANFNESIILIQEILDKIIFNKYFNITYLGKTIECQIQFERDYNIQINQINMETPDSTNKIIELPIKVLTNYPMINASSEINATNIISKGIYNIDLVNESNNKITDTISSQNIIP